MCGIVGCIKNDENRIDINFLLESIKHRGPDAQNYFENDFAMLGHTRLSIVDLENGHQPFEYKNYIIVFNGEIFNHKILREDLVKLGYIFKTNSDTEVLLKLYDCYKEKFVDKLQGFYAFVIYDKHEKEFIIARDYFGIKPLYIYSDRLEFLFSSEMLTLISLLKEKKIKYNLSKDAQIEFLDKGYIEKSNIVENTFELEKGFLFKYKDRVLTKLRAIDYSFDEINSHSTLESVLKDELTQQLDADVEVGILLSGGIDSSLITAISSKIKNNIPTYSVAFEDNNLYNESVYSDFVSNTFNTNHKKFLFTEEVLFDYIPKLIETIDIPIYDPAMLPMLYLCDNVSKTSKVVLSGDGGDELFAGYTHHRVLKYKLLYKLILWLLKRTNLFLTKAKIIEEIIAKHSDFKKSISHDLNKGLNLRLLRKTDLCSMRFGVEVRVPFLSKRVFNYSLKSNPRSYVDFFKGKKPLRKLVHKLINKEIAYKKKQGFRVPIKEWVSQGNLGILIEKELKKPLKIDKTILNQTDIKKYLSDKNRYYKELFSIFLLNSWIKKHL